MADERIIPLAGRTWLIPGPTNLGVYVLDEKAYLVDSGNDKDSARKILKIFSEKGWSLAAIVNTHSNADHIGGNNYLQEMTGCEIWAPSGEEAFISAPILEASFLWGGYPPAELRNKFFEAKPSRVTTRIEAPSEIGPFRFVPLKGHFFDMMGVLTPDGVFFAGDSVFGERILAKHPIPFIYDVTQFLASLDRLASVPASIFVPSHGEPCADPGDMVRANKAVVEDIAARLERLAEKPAKFEDLLGDLCSELGVSLDYGQYVLAGNTLRAFLTFLRQKGSLAASFDRNRMYWTARGANPDSVS